MTNFFFRCYSKWICLVITTKCLCFFGNNFTGLVAGDVQKSDILHNFPPTFEILSRRSVWQLTGSDFLHCDAFLFDSVDVSFHLIGGGVKHSLSKIRNEFLIQNVSTGGTNESLQNLTFHMILTSGDWMLFEIDGTPKVSRNGTLSFSTSSTATGYATFELFLVDDGGTENFGQNTSISKKISFSISPAAVTFRFYFPLINDYGLRQYIAEEAGVNPNDLISTCAMCMTNSTSGLSLVDRLDCTGQSSRRLLQNSSSSVHLRYLYRAFSLYDATEFLFFARNFLHIRKLISLNANFQPVEASAWTLNISPKISTFNLKDNISVSQDSSPFIKTGFAEFVIGSPVNITLDGQHLATFKVMIVDNPILFIKFPAIAADGTLSFSLAPQRPGVAMVSVVLENFPEIEKKFFINVLPMNSAPSFTLPLRVLCNGTEPCLCSDLEAPSTLQCCFDVPQNVSKVLIHEHITIVENTDFANQSLELSISQFASDISVSRGYLPWSVMTLSINDPDTIRLLNPRQQPVSGPVGSEYASSLTSTSSGLYVYMAEMLTDSISVYLDIEKAEQHLVLIQALISKTNISLNSVAEEDVTKDALALQIQEYQTEMGFLQSRIQMKSQSRSQELIFLDRRRRGEQRVRFENPKDLLDSQAACDLQTFDIATNSYVVVSTGCDFTDFGAQYIGGEYNRSMRTSNIPEPGLIDETKLSLLKLIEDFYKTDSFGTENMLFLQRHGCVDENSKLACLAVRQMQESRLWNRTIALWDFMSDTAFGSWTRPPIYKPKSCREKVDDLIINVSSFFDLSSKMGPSTLRGPSCKENTDWDTSSPISLNVETFMINNGVHEALQFDGILNLGLTVSDDIDLLATQGILPLKALTIETWVTIDTIDVQFAGLIAAAQSGPKYFRGWSLGYSVQNSIQHILWSISVQHSNIENMVVAECDPTTCFPGQWIHIAAVFNGIDAALYINGKLKSSRSICQDHCGSITYPHYNDGGWEGRTPLVIGAYNNIKSGTIYPHIGSIKRMRIYDIGLDSADVSAIFDKNEDLIVSGIHQETYWVSDRSFSSLSPAIPSITSSRRDNAGSKLTVFGQFNPLKSYACKFSNLKSAVTSSFVFPDHHNQIVCNIPEWKFGLKESVFSLTVCTKENCSIPADGQTLWQRVCLRNICGYPNVPNSTLDKLVGTKTKLMFTTYSKIYSLNGALEDLSPVATLTESLPTWSTLPFNLESRNYILAAHGARSISMPGFSRLYRLSTNVSGSILIHAIQDLYTPSIVQWKLCQSDSVPLFIAASFNDGVSVYSWNGSHLIWRENLVDTRGTVSMDCFSFKNRTFLALARYFDPLVFSHDLQSKIFSLENSTFIIHQNISVSGSVDVQHFGSRNTLFLVFAQMLGDTSTIMNYSEISKRFEILQMIGTKKPRRSSFFSVPGYGLFMIVAQSAHCLSHSSGEYGECSIMYRWNGTEEGECSTSKNSTCMFLSLTDPYTLMSDVAGGQAFGTWSLMRTLRGVIADIVFSKNLLIFATFEGYFADDNYSRAFASKVFNLRTENLNDVLSAPSVLAVSPDNGSLIVADQIFYPRGGQWNTSGQRNPKFRLSVFMIDKKSGLLSSPTTLWEPESGYHSYVSAMVFATTADLGTHLYVATAFPGSIFTFSFEPVDGRHGTLQHEFVGLSGLRSLSLSENNSMLFATSYTDSSLTVFIRNEGDGLLSLVDKISDGQTMWDSLVVPIRWNLTAAKSMQMNTRESVKPASKNADRVLCGHQFFVDGHHFFGICYNDIIHVFHWEKESFLPFQTLPLAQGAKDLHHLQVSDVKNTNDFLIVVCQIGIGDENYFSNSATKIFRWNSSLEMFLFACDLEREADNLETVEMPLRAQPFTLYSDFYIGVVYTSPRQFVNVASILYKWDGRSSKFVKSQRFDTNRAIEIAYIFASGPEKGYPLLVIVDTSHQTLGGIQNCKLDEVNLSNNGLIANWSNSSNQPTCSKNAVQRTQILVFVFDDEVGSFVELQRIDALNIVDLEPFSIPDEVGSKDSFASTRYFLAAGSKYVSYPVSESDYKAYDAVSYIYEWTGSGFTKVFNFSGFSSAPEPWCEFSEQVCNCDDNQIFGSINFWGECATYSPGGSNHGYCTVDNVCNFCPLSCADQCKNSCFVAEDDISVILKKRRAMKWNTTGGLRGVSKLRHFQVMDTHYLAIGQSVCEEDVSMYDCIHSGKIQPKSAILQWNSTGFKELEDADGQHSFALRIAAGSVTDLQFMEINSTQNDSFRVRFLVFFSQTRGLVAYKWNMNVVSGLRSALGAADDGRFGLIYVLGEVDRTLTAIQLEECRDGLNRLVSKLKVKRTWTNVHGLSSGMQSLRASRNGNEANLTVQAFQRQTELVCGPTPMVVGSAGNSFFFSSTSYCQTPQFDLVQVYKTGSLSFADRVSVLANGTLKFAPLPIGHGWTLFRVTLSDDGESKFTSDPLYFSVRVVPARRAPTYDIQEIFVNQTYVGSDVIRKPFVKNIQGGAGEDVNRTFRLFFISLSNPEYFKENPILEIEGNTGYISFSLVPFAFGISDVNVILTDEIGTSEQGLNKCRPMISNISNMSSSFRNADAACLCSAINKQSENASSVISFSIHISSRYLQLNFDLVEHYVFMAEKGEHKIDQFVRNLPSALIDSGEEFSFVLSRIDGSEKEFNLVHFSDGAVLRNGTLKFSVSESAMMIFKSVSLDTNSSMLSAPTTSGDGIILLSFSIHLQRGIESKAFVSITKSCIISIIKMSYIPSFVLISDVLNVSSSESADIMFNISFASNISSAFVLGKPSQAVTFVIDIVSGSDLFSSLPVCSSDGFLFFKVKAKASGVSILQIRLLSDGQQNFNALSASSAKTLVINVTLSYIHPSFDIIEDIFLPEIRGEYKMKSFATNITTSAIKKDKTFSFKLMVVLSEPWNLLSTLPSIDEDGTLAINPTAGVYGSAKIYVTLESSHEEQHNNAATSKSFVLHILPSPVLSSVFPAIAPASGGTLITIQGADMNLLSASMVEVRIGNSLCTNVEVLYPDELTCILSYGTGLQDVLVSVVKYGTVWAGVKIGGLTQIDIIFSGISGMGSDGYIAAVPRPDIAGNLVNVVSGGAFVDSLSISNGKLITDGAVHTVLFFKDRVYFGGSFLSVGKFTIQYIASFDGNNVMPLGLGLDGPVYTLAIYMDLLIVGGAFQHLYTQVSNCIPTACASETISGLAAWNGTNWFSIIESNPLIVHGVLVNNSLMYVSGEFNGDGFGNQMAVINGSSISFLCELLNPHICGVLGGQVYAMAIMNYDLYVGGSFIKAGSVKADKLARWDGKQWFSVASVNGDVYALRVFGGRLIIGGEFTRCNAQLVHYVAEFSGGHCSGFSEGLNGPVYAFSGLDQCLYICGRFNSTSKQALLHKIPVKNVMRFCVNNNSTPILEAIDLGDMNCQLCKGISTLL